MSAEVTWTGGHRDIELGIVRLEWRHALDKYTTLKIAWINLS
ncbi:MAG: hypothetical protein ACJA09_002586 [Alcanivorax sp.]|jgi:hypothetical protein